jgi:hypothetical protein
MAQPFLMQFGQRGAIGLDTSLGLATQTCTKAVQETSDMDNSFANSMGTLTGTATREGTDQDKGHSSFRLVPSK